MYSRVQALNALMTILYFPLSVAILFQMLTSIFLRSSSILSSHLIGGRPALLVPCNVVNINSLQGKIFVCSKKVSLPSYSSRFYLLDDVMFIRKVIEFIVIPSSPAFIVTSCSIYFSFFLIAYLSSLYLIMAQVSHPYNSIGLFRVLYSLLLVFMLT
jgi:hypothetical protein